MYPNPQDVLPLPPRPHLDQYRKRARELVRAFGSGDDAIRHWAADWVGALLALQPADVDSSQRSERDAKRRSAQIADFARDRMTRADGTLSQAQFVIARAHGFASWPRFVRHIEELTGAGSHVATFERAADAVVNGDLPALERLLAADRRLVHARSTREHAATLLHYVSANGVENYRQKTPPNIIAIARRLLAAGAEVDAEADVYGGGCTTLALVVTSTPPREAGVQVGLADLLLEQGARIDRDIVRSCLMNGCPEAAAHMAARGAAVGLEEAAGIGRLDIVAHHFEPSRTAGEDEAAAALMMASWYDQRDVVRLLLDADVPVTARMPHDGHTALHIAAYVGLPALTELLLSRQAPVNVTDALHGTPPLVWALHAWLVDGRPHEERYGAVLRMLVDAGAAVKPEWIEHERLRAEPELYAVLLRRATT